MNRPARLIVHGAMALLAIPLLPAARAAGDTAVGVVAEYRPASGHYVIERGKPPVNVPVQIGTLVQGGDRLELPVGATVTLQLAAGTPTLFKGPGTFVVPATGPLGRLAAILGSIPDLFDDEYRLAGTAASRGGEACERAGTEVKPIDVPILVPGARVVAGSRDLPLAWRGGCPPFVVQVLAGGDKLVHRESIAGWQVRLDDVPLAPGTYDVRISDASGRWLQRELMAVASAPQVPAEIAGDTSPLGITSQAVWLAQFEGGRWRLDGFERLRPLIRAGDPLAGTIGDGILWGN